MNEESNHEKEETTGPELVCLPVVSISGQEETKPFGAQVQCSVPEIPVVVLTQVALTQALAYATTTDLEISALGVVERDGAIFRVTGFHLVEQTSSMEGRT